MFLESNSEGGISLGCGGNIIADDGDFLEVKIVTLSADAGGPYSGNIDENIQFYGSAKDGITPYSYYWNFGDGHTSNQKNPIHPYSTCGTKTVTLTVTDSNGATASDTTTANINCPPNTPSAPQGPPPPTVYKNEAYSYSISTNDPEGDDITY